MIDYLAHVAAIEPTLNALSSVRWDVIPADRLTAAAQGNPDLALLGSLVDHLIWHSSSDGAELAHVREASALWQRGLAVYDRVTAARELVEASLRQPNDPGAPQQFADAYASLVALRKDVKDVADAVVALRGQLGTLPHLKLAHPQQVSLPVHDWDWSNRFLGRRTAAFPQELMLSAHNNDGALAFSAGTMVSYLSNTIGSAYLGTVVGGPRRLHRFRDRLARNSVGAWLGDHLSLPSFAELASRLSFGASSTANVRLPATVRQDIESALGAVFPGMPTMGDLDVGLQRMTEHLRLLDSFNEPPLPGPLPPALGATLSVSAATGAPVGVQPLGADVFGNGDPQPGGGTGETTTTSDKRESSGDACVAIVGAAIAIGLYFLIDCFVQLAERGECSLEDSWNQLKDAMAGEDDHPEQVSVSGQSLLAMAGDGRGAKLVQHILELQMTIWQAFNVARTFLATTGLIYPNESQLSSPLFSQFVVTPTAGPDDWPHREEPAALDDYIYAPISPIEHPAGGAHFIGGEDPAVFVMALETVGRELLNTFWSAPTNLNLDADRAWLHACWDLQPGSTITDDPLSVAILEFEDI